jgi:predicted amidohydrolase
MRESGPSPLQVAILQHEGVPGDPQANLEILGKQCAASALRGDALLVTPELFVSGYFIADRVAALAVGHDSVTVDSLRELARVHGVALCVGYPERCGDGVYNAAVLIDAAGRVLGHYRKHRLSGDFEIAAFRRGDGRDLVVDLGGVVVGVLICYDAEFPENVRRLAMAGVQVLVTPTALSAEFAFVAEKMMPTRAFENGLFVVYADRCGTEPGKAFAGRSCIVAPDGSDLARAGTGNETIRARIVPQRYRSLRARLCYLHDLRDDAAGRQTE